MGKQIFYETPEHVLDNNNYGYQSVYSIDLDQDGDQDIISTEYNDYGNQGPTKVYWYKNNGSESFTSHIITTTANGARSVYAIDIDSDGDIDDTE